MGQPKHYDMRMLPRQFLASVRDRLARSRVFTISLTLHILLIVLFGGAVIIDVQFKEPAEMTATDRSLVQPTVAALPPRPESVTPAMDVLNPSIGSQSPLLPPTDANFPPITIYKPDGPQISVEVPAPRITQDGRTPAPVKPNPGMTREEMKGVIEFTKWRDETKGGKDRFSFVAYIGRYQGGNWNSTVRVVNNQITGGSLPNLLYALNQWSDQKVRTNERDVKALPLDSDELLSTRPPFIFLTGTRDFVLTEKEVENLRHYIRLGGAIWGDSSVPGERSAFDNAFRREMRRVMPDGGQQFEDLPADHTVFTGGYFPKVKSLPSGINHYRQPVSVLRWNGEIAVIQTRNDYGDMWQVGLDKNGKIDLSRNARGEYVAMDQNLWAHRDVYIRNIEQPAVEEAYKFGINMVMHLLTRWDKLAQRGAAL
jgi:Domain of unknown function (DUF4159)